MLEAKRGHDIQNYLDAICLLVKAGKGVRSDNQVDQAWVERTQKLNEAETTRLNHELKGYKNNLIKESIRVSQLRPFYRGCAVTDLSLLPSGG